MSFVDVLFTDGFCSLITQNRCKNTEKPRKNHIIFIKKRNKRVMLRENLISLPKIPICK